MDTPSTSEQQFEQYLPRVLRFLVALATITYFFIYLLAPWYPRQNDPDSENHPVRSVSEDFLLDCFLLSDASISSRNSDYRIIAQDIRSRLKPGAGDRISFAYFGTGTVPNPIQPPSSNPSSIDAQMQHAPPTFHTTDFAGLFYQLQETIRDDRLAQAAVDRSPHADTILILTDGIPDLTSKPSHCPDPNYEFISDQIVKAFRTLLNSSYATQEPIYVRLILAGAPPECESSIKGQWEKRLGWMPPRGAFQVLESSDLQNIDNSLLKPMRRQPRVILSLSYKDHARRRLDLSEDFMLQYSARSLLRGGEVRIKSGIIADEKGNERLQLHALKDCDSSPIEDDSVATINVPDPPSDGTSLLGPSVRGSICFRPVDRHGGNLSELARYSLQLQFASETPVEINPSNFALEPCHHANQRSEAESRLQTLGIWLFIIGLIFSIGTLLWYMTRKAALGSKWKKLSDLIKKSLILPHHIWFAVLIIFLVPMATALFFLESIAVSVGIGVLLGLGLFVLERFEKYKKSPTVSLFCYTIEFLILPFLHLLISKLE